MRLTFSSIEVTEWNYDDKVFNTGKNVALPVIDEIFWQTITRVSNEIPVGFVGLKWFYKIKNKQTEKEVVSIIADDYWMANFENRVNDNEALDEMIVSSYKRFAGEFDKRKLDIGIRAGMPLVDKKDVVQIRKDILAFLSKKGI